MRKKTAGKEIHQELEQAIALSLCLSQEEKERILKTCEACDEPRKKKILRILQEQQTHQDNLLEEFFVTHPHLFQEYERLSDQRMSDIFYQAERTEKKHEERRLISLLESHFSSPSHGNP